MKLKIIAAIGKNNELGISGGLPPWKLQKDMERFRNLTTDGTVVMGRKTFESFPEKFRPLPNRRNIVLTRDKSWGAAGAESFESLELILTTPPTPTSKEVGHEDLWIIGGGEIYKQFLHKADELHITHVDGEFSADTFFPEIDKNIWEVFSEEIIPADEKNSHQSVYTIYRRIVS